jgi:uncharacterized membrane protein required for colicin V production
MLLCVANFYLKSSAIRSFAAVISALLAVVAAFNYYEVAADLLISRGLGGQWVQPGIFVFIFLATFALAKSLADFLLRPGINFGAITTRLTATISGTIVGLIISGILLIAVAMTPLGTKWPYARFEEGNINVKNPNKALFNIDGFVAALFGWMSKGSLSSQKSFSIYHADFISQLHLNRHKVKDEVYSIAAADAITVPAKRGVRIQDIDDHSFTVVNMGIKAKEIADGGAMDKNDNLSFTLSQVRLICKEKSQASVTSGNATVIYPAGQIFEKQFERINLDETITFSRRDFQGTSKTAWMDLAFTVPSRI